MNTRTRIALVVVCLLFAVGMVYALSTRRLEPSTRQEAATITPPGTPVASRRADAEAPTSLSPDLTRTDAYTFLDPVPVGKRAPDFSVKSADAKPIRLSGFRGKKNVVLIFYQGSFCGVCGHQLTNLQKHLDAFRAQDAEIIAISADDAAHASQSVGEHGLTFPVVPDPQKAIIRQFGIGNISKQGIAWPSVFVVDKKGTVRLSFASQEGHRLHSNEILPVLSKITGKPVPNLTYEQ